MDANPPIFFLSSRGFTWQSESSNVYISGPREDTQEREKRMQIVAGEGKKSEILAVWREEESQRRGSGGGGPGVLGRGSGPGNPNIVQPQKLAQNIKTQSLSIWPKMVGFGQTWPKLVWPKLAIAAGKGWRVRVATPVRVLVAPPEQSRTVLSFVDVHSTTTKSVAAPSLIETKCELDDTHKSRSEDQSVSIIPCEQMVRTRVDMCDTIQQPLFERKTSVCTARLFTYINNRNIKIIKIINCVHNDPEVLRAVDLDAYLFVLKIKRSGIWKPVQIMISRFQN